MMEGFGLNPPWSFVGFKFMDLEKAIQTIIQNTLFLGLKDVVENNAYHDHEPVYSHLIKTKDIALNEIKGDFITSLEAKKHFLKFVNENFQGMKRADIMILIALLHDIGKILSVKEDDNVRPIAVTDSSGTTSIPGHEYWGSTIIGTILQDFTLKFEIITYIVNVVRLHDTFGGVFFDTRKDLSTETLLNDVKSRAEGLYKEAMFNQYCDCFSAKPFEYGKEMLIKLFNEPDLYKKREYVIT